MAASSSASDRVAALAESFLARYRRGERPALAEYIDRYPELAEEIRAVFPAMVEMEQLGPTPGDPTGSFLGRGPADDPPVRQIGDYLILREIGRGGMGVVYEAEQESLGRHVALKVLPGYARLDPKLRERFRREAKAAARLHHTNIVPVFGVGEHQGTPYYVMQFIQGQALDEVLREVRRIRRAGPPSPAEPIEPRPASAAEGRAVSAAEVAQALLTGQFTIAQPDSSGPVNSPGFGGRDLGAGGLATATATATLPEARAVAVADNSGRSSPSAGSGSASASWPGRADTSTLSGTARDYWRGVARLGVQAAGALHYAHGQGTLHRDIKPSNLLLDLQGTVWVTDFGLAKAADEDDLTHTGDLIGTLRYMAPERFRSASDPRSDVYGLGMTLYELLTFRPAFVEADRERLIHQITQSEPPRPSKLNGEVPRDLETIVLKAIDRDPARRYPSAGDLADDLQRFLDDRPIRARRTSPAERAWRWCRRNPAVATLAATLAALLLTAAAGSAMAAVRFNRVAWRERGARKEASVRAEEARRALVRLSVTNGAQLLGEGDPFGAMPWFAEALRLDQGDASAEEAHRIRLATIIRQCPRLAHLWVHDGIVRHAEFSPDGRRVVSASFDRTARVWDTRSGETLLTITHEHPVYHACFSPDGRLLATASGDWERGEGQARVWDATTGAPVSPPLRHSGRGQFATDDRTLTDTYRDWLVAWVARASFSPDSRRIVTAGGDGTARIWDVSTGESVIVRHDRPVCHAEFSTDGRRIVTASLDQTARVWDALTGQSVLPPIRLDGVVRHATFSPDGRRILTARAEVSDWGGEARIWDATTGKPLAEPMKHRGEVRWAAFSPDGRLVVTASSDRTARIWDATTGRSLTPPLRHQHGLVRASFSRDSRRVATASEDGTARVWNVRNGEPVTPYLRQANDVYSASFSPEGRFLVTASTDRTVRVWDLASGDSPELITGHGFYVSDVAFSPDGRRVAIAYGDGKARIWDLSAGRLICSPATSGARMNHLEFSPDGRRLVTALGNDSLGQSGEVRVWDADTGTPLSPPMKLRRAARWAQFSPDGRRLVIAGSDSPTHKGGEARVWDASTGTPISAPMRHEGVVSDARFSPDGRRIVTASLDATARIWDAATGDPVSPPLAHPTLVVQASFSPDGRRVLTACRDDTESECDALLWDSTTGRRIGRPLRHDDGVGRASFSPDGRRIVTASEDGTARVWDSATGTPITPPIDHGSYVIDAAFSPDGRRVVTGSSDGVTRVWDAATGYPLIPPLSQGYHINRVMFSPDGRRVLAGCGDGTTRIWDIDARPSRHAVPDLVLQAQLLAGQRVDVSGGLTPLEPTSLAGAWQTLRSRTLASFAPSSRDELAWHRREAIDCQQGRQWGAAVTHLDRVLERDPSRWLEWFARGHAHAESGHWAHAAADFDRARAMGDADATFFSAVAWWGAGRLAEYRHAWSLLQEHTAKGGSREDTGRLIALCSIIPDFDSDPEAVVKLAERFPANDPKDWDAPYRLGMALYRAGRYEAAIERLDQSRGLFPGPVPFFHDLFLAMAHRRVGHVEAARRCLEECLREIDPPSQDTTVVSIRGVPLHWVAHLALMRLRREAEDLVRRPTPELPDDVFAR